ncbi:hypothetical protein Poly30_18710 [Planctomycetes bacterium Poly30]|uniref:Outer membrane protein transport protein (OMPP1/FadL/TodX) n=1 Tax=Saltatorellus ferox TaxID=2528018 RepID=A0A518EQK5_9BACT|nr:hypothetical protein Poly30_18710 [Planctomycetes bacterium Poly30]
MADSAKKGAWGGLLAEGWRLSGWPVAAAAVLLAPSASAQISSGARSDAMGGAGVASALPTAAAFVNPALTRFRDEAIGLSVVAPFVTVTARDPEELLNALDEFQSTLSTLEALVAAGDPTAATLRPFAASQLAGLGSSAIDVTADTGIAVLIPNVDYTVTLSARTRVDARALPFIDPSDVATISDLNSTSADLDSLLSEAGVVGASVTEFGATFAIEGEINGHRISAGLTPKAQWIETYNYSTGVTSFEDGSVLDEFRSAPYRNHFNDYNVDLGIAYELQPGATVGLAALNVLRDSYTTVNQGGREFTYWIEPRPTAGIALSQLGFTFTADLDLIKTTRFRGIGDSQFLRMGFEYDAFGWGQLRAGFSHDFINTIQDVFTFGLGVSPAETVRLDLAGQLGNHSLGAALQLSLTL